MQCFGKPACFVTGVLLLLVQYPATFGADITVYASTGAQYTSINAPDINDQGIMVFRADLSGGGSGIFRRGAATVTTPIAGTSTGYTPVGSPRIDNSGSVSFIANIAGDQRGVYAGNGGSIATIGPPISTTSTFPSYGGLRMSSAGSIAVTLTGITNYRWIHVYDNGSLSLLIEEGGIGNSMAEATGINNSGTTLFGAIPFGGSQFNLYALKPGGSLSTIASGLSTAVGYGINDSGVALFRGVPSGGTTSLYTGNGSGLTPIADIAGPYALFNNADINNAGMVAFEATLDGGGKGIFSGSDPTAHKIVQTGDLLSGSLAITNVTLGAINNNGLVAFRYELSDGSSGVAVTQIPEPAHLIALAGLALLTPRTRRKIG